MMGLLLCRGFLRVLICTRIPSFAAKRESILDPKRLHLVSIALRSAKLDYEAVLGCVAALNRAGLPLGTLEVRLCVVEWGISLLACISLIYLYRIRSCDHIPAPL